MLRKYLKRFKGGRAETADRDAPGASAEDTGRGAGSDVTAVIDAATERAHGRGGEMLRRFLGRQPILDASSQIVGYELKIRDKSVLPDESDENQRTLQDEMLVISVIDLDYQKALGNRLTFIGVAPAMLDNPLIAELPKQKVVVGIALPQTGAEALLPRCRKLAEMGVPLALDEFEFRPEHEPFLKICSYVRVDTTRFDALTLSQHLLTLRSVGSPGVIATGVETDDAFEAYRKLSFDLYQGHYFARLRPSAPRRLDSDRLRVIELLNMVMNHAELPELEEKVKLDPALSYKLLSFINSPANGLSQQIRSIGHALTLLGYDQLYRWLTLLLFSSGKPDARNRSLLRNALVRARFTETLGQDRFPPAEQGSLFIVGVFSLLDVLLNVPMAEAIARLNLPQPVVDALLHRTGKCAPYLQLAIACEDFNQEVIAHCAAECGLSADAVNLIHVNALIWSEEVDI